MIPILQILVKKSREAAGDRRQTATRTPMTGIHLRRANRLDTAGVRSSRADAASAGSAASAAAIPAIAASSDRRDRAPAATSGAAAGRIPIHGRAARKPGASAGSGLMRVTCIRTPAPAATRPTGRAATPGAGCRASIALQVAAASAGRGPKDYQRRTSGFARRSATA